MSKNRIAVFSGSGIGLLIGVLMGLAVSPTVGVIIGALSSLLAVLLGLNDQHFSDTKAFRIGSFGFACVLGAFLGIFVRTNNLLSPSLTDLKETYMEIGYLEPEALDFIAFKEFGILDEKWKMATGPATGKDSAKAGMVSTVSLTTARHASVLFAAEVNLSACDGLESTNASLPASEIINNFRLEGGFWSSLADAVKTRLTADYQGPVLVTAKDVLCSNETEKIDDADCARLTDLSRSSSLDNLRQAFVRTGGIWKKLAGEMAKLNSPQDQEKMGLLILRDCLCEEKVQKGGTYSEK